MTTAAVTASMVLSVVPAAPLMAAEEYSANVSGDTSFQASSGTAIEAQYITIDLTNCMPVDPGAIAAGMQGLPEGLSLGVDSYDENHICFAVYGTPVSENNDPIELTIPAGTLLDSDGEYIQDALSVSSFGVCWNIAQGEEAAADTTITEVADTETESTDTDTTTETTAETDVDDGPTTAEEAEAISDSTNEELISAQTILELPQVEADFRFIHIDVDKQYFASNTFVYSDMSTQAGIIGAAVKGDTVYTILEEEDDWLYVESGKVRGFVKASKITDTYPEDEDDSEAAASETETEKAEETESTDGDSSKTETEKTDDSAIEEDLTEEESDEIEEAADSYAIPLTSEVTSALTYTRTSAMEVAVEKVPLITKKAVNVLEEKDVKTARTIGTLSTNGIAYLLQDDGDGWLFVESGDVRGFVKASDLYGTDESAAKVEANGESYYAEASELIEPEDNKNLYYTITSIKEGTLVSAKAQAIIEYASQFLGNPYLWGGTDPVNGSDCSGFVQSVYGAMGYSLPRTSREQSVCSTQVSLDSLSPGDLVFYASAGVVYHVMIYIGDGMTLENAGDAGVTVRNLSYDAAVWGVRVITEDDAGLTSATGVLTSEKVTADDSSSTESSDAKKTAEKDPSPASVASSQLLLQSTIKEAGTVGFNSGNVTCICLNIERSGKTEAEKLQEVLLHMTEFIS